MYRLIADSAQRASSEVGGAVELVLLKFLIGFTEQFAVDGAIPRCRSL
jgi:hypothetical protein